MVYKQGPRFEIRPVNEILEDLKTARRTCGQDVRTLFLPAGNTIAMPTEALAQVCRAAHDCFPDLERITVYGSSQYIHQKGPERLRRLALAGLGRIHVGLESGSDTVLDMVCKGTHTAQQTEACQWVKASGMELSVYVILGIGGQTHTREHALDTAKALNAIEPDFIRLRTFVPKIHTPLLDDVRQGRFEMLGPHGILAETALLIRHLNVRSRLASDHYTNYLNLDGELPRDRDLFLNQIALALECGEEAFRPFFIGQQ
jgi:radical SAM superfamily enzyme YgiQ (UPF0313 family)